LYWSRYTSTDRGGTLEWLGHKYVYPWMVKTVVNDPEKYKQPNWKTRETRLLESIRNQRKDKKKKKETKKKMTHFLLIQAMHYSFDSM
jgi:hypothetical protein